MFLALCRADLDARAAVFHPMLADRGRQFVARHRWPLRLDHEGLETDEFDDPSTTYCVVAEGDRHLASLRLRPAADGSMAERYFPALWREPGARLRGTAEVSRFCAAPGLSPETRLNAVSDLLLGVCRHCQRVGIASFFGVVFPPVARVIRQAGWPPSVLRETRDARGTLLLAEWTPDELVAWSIQEQRELREEAWARRREERLAA
jgi:N-acyl-L-homoserine lactone synthetase